MAEADLPALAPPRLKFPPPGGVSSAAPTANGLLSSQQSPAAIEVAEAQRANLAAAEQARNDAEQRAAEIEIDRTAVVLPAMVAWRQKRPVAPRVAYSSVCMRLGAAGFAAFGIVHSVVHPRADRRSVPWALLESAGLCLFGGAVGWIVGSVVDDVVGAARPPVPLPPVLPTEVRADLVKAHNPPRHRLDGWLVSWRELADEENSLSSSAGGNSAVSELSTVASLMRSLRAS